MEKYNYENNLKKLFQQLTLMPLNDKLALEVEELLKNIVDSNNTSYFSNPLTYNLIFLLKSNKLSFYLEHLLKEVELKLMRLAFDSCEEKNCNNIICNQNNNSLYEEILNPSYKGPLPEFPNMPKPQFGQTATVKEELLINGQRIINYYTIDHNGKTLSYDKKTIEKVTNSNIKHLNESVLYDALKNNLNKKK